MWGHHGFRIMGNFLRPLNEMLGSTTDILWWYRAYFYGRLCPICYWGWVLVVLFLCTNFRIFDRFVVEEYIFHVDRGPHLFQSCLCVARDDFLPIVRDMHFSFESLAITGTISLQASLMNIHHDTSLRSILEDDFISLTSKAHIYSCLARGQGYGWLPYHLFVCFTSHILLSFQHCIFVLV